MSRSPRHEHPAGRRPSRRPGPRDRARPLGTGPAPAAPASGEVPGAPGRPVTDEPFVHVTFRGGRREAFVNPERLVLRCGDFIIVEAERGHDLGRVSVCDGTDLKRRRKQPVRAILRHATHDEATRVQGLAADDRAAFENCRARVAHFGLDMKIIDAETQFDGNRITFYFTAERRVDFRDLVRDLAGVFRTRIELRQVGARDAARRCDGMGPCGRQLCCTSFLRDFDPVTLKMAKEQNLPLNPAKISGSCGRLMCCLNYEVGAYQSARREAPTPGSRWTFEERECSVRRFDAGRHQLLLEDDRGETRTVDLGLFLKEAQPVPSAEPVAGGASADEPPA
jgi:cell fate regulator YaaT (PSP1 superfamily)